LHIHLKAYSIEGIKSGGRQAGAFQQFGVLPIAFMQTIPMSKKTRKPTAAPVNGASKPNKASKLPAEFNVVKVATLKDLRKATQHTQDDLAVAMGVGQGTVSRIEKRDDMLVSTLQHYVEGVGGTLQILATFPNRPPLVIERLGKKINSFSKVSNKKSAGPNSLPGT